jgi:signal transduction histidine kinase
VSGAIVYLRLDGSLKLLGHFGLLHDSQQAPEGLRDDAETILASMMKARAPIWLSGEGFDALLPHLAERRARTKNGTFALLPLIIQDEPAGMLGLWAADHDGFIDEDRELMMALANQIALTLERTILSRSEAAAREALARSEERMRHAFDAASLGAFSYEIATGATTFDAQMYAHWGLPFGRHIELSELRKRVHPDDWNQWDAAYVEARLRPEGRFDFVFRRVDEQGQVVRHLRCAGRTQFDGDRAVQVSGLMQDVSDRWAYEEELRRRAEVEEQLVGIVSHDLRSPLSAIVLLAGALKGDVSDRPNALRAVDRLTRSADRVSRMVNDLLDFTQARLGGGIPMRKAEIDLAPVLDETIDLLRTEHPARTILFERDATLLGTWDGDRLAQVAQNLVKNALAYSDAGTPVTVRAARQGDDVALDVHNHGEPIEQARLADLFLPLTRATSEGAAKRSIGLGLFIVERIVSAHGGRIEVTSSRDDGTRFVVALPVTPP